MEFNHIFTDVTHVYKATLEIKNMKSVNESAQLVWNVIVAEPIHSDWRLDDFEKVIRPNSVISFKLLTKPDGKLPTMPTIRILKIKDDMIAENIDSVSHGDPLPLTMTWNDTMVPTNCLQENCTMSFQLEELGLSSFDHINANSDGKFGNNISIIASTIIKDDDNNGGYFGLAIDFLNGISHVSISHDTKLPIMESVQVLDKISGEYLEVTAPKWQYIWIESFAKLEGPVNIDLQYKLPDPKITNTYPLDYYGGKFYIPTGKIPSFTISYMKGTAQKVHYNITPQNKGDEFSINCTNTWPKGSGEGKKEFTIDSCQNELVSFLSKAFLKCCRIFL